MESTIPRGHGHYTSLTAIDLTGGETNRDAKLKSRERNAGNLGEWQHASCSMPRVKDMEAEFLHRCSRTMREEGELERVNPTEEITTR
jgi:hypothetical protein